jgi:hypothetical protein
VNDGMVPLGSVPPIEDGRGPLKGGGGSVRMKLGGWCPEGVQLLGVLDEICVGEGIKALNAWYPGGSVGVTLGESGVSMGAWLAEVIPV